jgi:hypothetical protein
MHNAAGQSSGHPHWHICLPHIPSRHQSKQKSQLFPSRHGGFKTNLLTLMFTLFGKKKTVIEQWVANYPKTAMDDIRVIDRYFKDVTGKKEVDLIPFVNVTADSLIYLPAWSIINGRKSKSKAQKQFNASRYYTENSIIEISMYLLFYSEWMCEGSSRVRPATKELIRRRFFKNLTSLTGTDYTRHFEARSSIYQNTIEEQIPERLKKFLCDTKVRGKVIYHEATTVDQRIDIHKPEGFTLLLDFDIIQTSIFDIYLREVVPALEKETDKKITEWFYLHLNK